MLLAEIILATVAYHVPFSSEANNPLTWCSDGVKIEPVDGKVWIIDGEYERVIVKAGAGQYANTVYQRPLPGLGAYADTNGNFKFDPAGPGGDKDISHVIVCPKQSSTSSPSPSASSPRPSPSTTQSESVAPTPTPSQTGSKPASTPTSSGNDPELAETGSNTAGALAAGILLALIGGLMKFFSRR